MSTVGSFDRTKHLTELNDPLDTQEGVLSPATRKARTVAALGITALAADLNLLAGAAAAGLLVGFMPAAEQEAINANGALSLAAYYTAITSVVTTGQAFTLADGTIEGHLKKFQLIVDGGDATVTFNSTATIVMADVGDYAILMWNGTDWVPIELGNDADGVSAPVYTPA